jgi:ribosomal protein S18 acetylase RimI-like enzyme
MNPKINVVLLETLLPETELELSGLLTEVVEDGASVGFLPPVTAEEASAYWKSVPDPHVLLWTAMEGDKIAGTVQLHLAAKANARHRAEIAKLMVHPEHRRKGIAGLLLDTAEQAAAAAGRTLLVLDTREGDPSNLLYQSRGYIEAGRIPNYCQSVNGQLDATVLYYKLI